MINPDRDVPKVLNRMGCEHLLFPRQSAGSDGGGRRVSRRRINRLALLTLFDQVRGDLAEIDETQTSQVATLTAQIAQLEKTGRTIAPTCGPETLWRHDRPSWHSRLMRALSSAARLQSISIGRALTGRSGDAQIRDWFALGGSGTGREPAVQTSCSPAPICFRIVTPGA